MNKNIVLFYINLQKCIPNFMNGTVHSRLQNTYRRRQQENW